MARPRTYLEERDRNALTQEELMSVLHYDEATGLFTWKKYRNQHIGAGDRAGSNHPRGYTVISVMRHFYLAHRLAWLYVTGAWPDEDLDHINGIPTDNRIANLRPATDRTNSRNKGLRSDNKIGLKGVGKGSHPAHDGRKWRARIRVDGKLLHLGYFATPEEAHAAYCRAAQEHFGEFARAS